jgi:hypothetical protein
VWLPAGGQVQVERRHVVQHSVKGLLRVLPCLADLEVILRGKFPAKNGVTIETSGYSYGLINDSTFQYPASSCRSQQKKFLHPYKIRLFLSWRKLYVPQSLSLEEIVLVALVQLACRIFPETSVPPNIPIQNTEKIVF